MKVFHVETHGSASRKVIKHKVETVLTNVSKYVERSEIPQVQEAQRNPEYSV